MTTVVAAAGNCRRFAIMELVPRSLSQMAERNLRHSQCST